MIDWNWWAENPQWVIIHTVAVAYLVWAYLFARSSFNKGQEYVTKYYDLLTEKHILERRIEELEGDLMDLRIMLGKGQLADPETLQAAEKVMDRFREKGE